MRPVVFAETTASAVAAGAGAGTGSATAPWPGSFVLRTRAPRLGAAPRIVTFPRRQARYVRVTIEPLGLAGPRSSIRTLSVIDGSCPTIDLALRKPVTASSVAPAPAYSATDNPNAAASAVDGNPGTHWSPAPHDERPWIQLDLGEPVFFDQLCVVSDTLNAGSHEIRVLISQDREHWIEPEPADDPLSALRLDLGTRLPACSADCGPLHVQPDTETWQVYAVNHTAVRVTGAGLSARIYEPFGSRLSHIEQQDVIIEPLSVAPGFVVPRPAYFPPTHLVSLQLHDADGALLSEHNCWRYRAETSPAPARITAL